MDVKEPSVHASQRSRSQTNRSQQEETQIEPTSIEQVAQLITTEPENKVSKMLMMPLTIGTLLENLVNVYYFYVVWYYVGYDGISQLSIAYSLQYFITTAIPRAYAQATVQHLAKSLADNMNKQLEETLAYHFFILLMYWVVTLFLAFILTISFPAMAALGTQTNYVSAYLPIKIALGTLFSIFNEATEALLLFEGRSNVNFMRQIATTFLSLLCVLVGYQFCSAQKVPLNLSQLAVGQIIGQAIPAAVMMNYYQGFKEYGYQGLIKANFKTIKPFNTDLAKKLTLMALPKFSQFGSQALMCFAANIVITITYIDLQDIWIARSALLMYYLGYNLFGSVTIACMSGSEAQLSLNLLMKKYIRSKTFMLKQFIWALIIQGILLILGFVGGVPILLVFVPNTDEHSKSLFKLYGGDYLKNSVYMPIAMLPFQYCEAVYSIESNWKMNLFLNLIHPGMSIIILLILQFTIGDCAILYWPEFYSDLFAGISGLILLFRKIFEVMQLSKIEMRRNKKKKRMEEEEAIAKKD